MKKIVSALALFLIVIIFSGCVTSTQVVFSADVDDVKMYIDGKPYGNMPVKVKMSNGIWEEPDIILEKEGYKTVYATLNKEIKGVNLVSGILIWWPSLLWVYGPEPEQYFHLTPEKKE